jgi:hypothetical protein
MNFARLRLAARGLAAVSVMVPAAHAQDPRVDYMLQCQGCHLADGSGKPGAVPDLRETLPLLLELPGAREYLVRVPGVAQAPLSDARLAALLDWLVREFAPAEREPTFAPEVARWRDQPHADVGRAREELLRRARTAWSASR